VGCWRKAGHLGVEFGKLDSDGVKKILVEEHDFSLERVEKGLGKLGVVKKKSEQRTLF